MEQQHIPATDPRSPEQDLPFFKRLWKEWGGMFIAFAVIIVLMKVVFQVAWVPTGSMETTIPARSIQLCWRLPYFFGDPEPRRGDVLTFWFEEGQEVLVKRCIGLPGETVSFRDGYVYIDGQLLDEPYLPIQGITQCDETFTVPQDSYFFLGDNRTGSYDSRLWTLSSYVPRSRLQARVLLSFSLGSEQSWQGVHIIR